jgi:methyltransferase-like protein/SAM-dependent methyltransferase
VPIGRHFGDRCVIPENTPLCSSAELGKAPNPYDLVPYESYPFPRSRIRHLHTLGRLFGMTPPDIRRCRVLELGCASGGNLIPMAIDHPGSTFGLDLSQRQIEMGRHQISDLGVGNIELRATSIMDVDESFGQFDYIVAHGVYSWAPEDVRDKVMAICRERLALDGIAVVSYNTLPGWSAWQIMREAILYHCKGVTDPLERVRRARRLLRFLREWGHKEDSPYWRLLGHEIDKMLELADWFLLHDHLEEDNAPVYFHQFIAHASRAGLQYLGEADLSAMHLRTLAREADGIPDASSDIVQRLQILDYLHNRRFRMSLLCHRDQRLDREISSDRLWSFLWSTPLRPQALPEDASAAIGGPLAFIDPAGNVRFTTNDCPSGAVFLTLCRLGLPTRPDDLIQEAMQRFGIEDDTAIRQALLTPALNLVMTNAIELHSHEASWITQVTERPMTSRLARYQARNSTTNQRHEAVGVDLVVREVIRYVDGRHSRTGIVEQMKRLVERGRLNLQHEGGR